MKKMWNFLKKVWGKLKSPWFRARSRYTKYYKKLPLDPRVILVEAQQGREIAGNIFYLLRYLSKNEKYADFKIYLSARGRSAPLFQTLLETHGMEDIGVVILAGDQYFRLLASAKYIITDNTILPFWLKKEGQCLLNTWHGTPLKTLGRKVNDDYHNIGNAQKNFALADYILFPNEHTRDCVIEDYMLRNISLGRYVLSGYPRNEAFFDAQAAADIRQELELEGKRVYAYMPTFRGTAGKGGTDKNDAYLLYYLCELDKLLGEDEVLYVNLHPVARSKVDFEKLFRHILPFPAQYETYEFLNAMDCLVTDYSSVFFDFAVAGKKIVLFPYDKEEYFRDRGTYLDMETLPFPQVFDLESLLEELRSGKNYDDGDFLKRFCPCEGPGAAQRLCDTVILGEDTGLELRKIQDNGKENILIYAGNLAGNGVTTSLRNMLSQVDASRYNYILTFMSEKVSSNRENIRAFPAGVSYYCTSGDMELTIPQRVFRKLFKLGLVRTGLYMKVMGKTIDLNWRRSFGDIPFRTVIQFNGYESETMLLWSRFRGNKVIFVHSDMKREIKTRGNQRADVLRYVYRAYDKVAVVTQDIYRATRELAGAQARLCLCRNAIDDDGVREKAERELELQERTRVYPEPEALSAILERPGKKFITVGRFSPEKGHFRLLEAYRRVLREYPDTALIVVGGSSNRDYYQQTVQRVEELGLAERVVLVMNIANPFPILKRCDYFVLSSLYEGFGLVLAEADILGKSVISTDIPGPRGFLREHGGTLVEDSQEGLYQGMKALLAGEIRGMVVDYKAYNQTAVEEFEALL